MLRCLAVLSIWFACILCGAEGQWTPQQVLKIDPAWLRERGLQLPPSRLWDPERGTGLLAAAINVGGCSGGFVSSTGLIVTNHHCLFGILQEHSTPEKDIITHGFVARSAADELPSKTTRITLPRRFADVTTDVVSAVPAAADDLARARAIEKKQKELVAACEQRKSARCRVAVFDGGVQYVLVDATEISDVRLVYAPPRAVGEYGGEIDNWMWPRHTGDFAIARAYVAPDGSPAQYNSANVPYRPEFWFPISAAGVSPGDFVMVLGYPGRTFRSISADEMQVWAELTFPRTRDVYGEWIHTIAETTEGDAKGRIALAATLKSLENVHKNALGQIAGLRRGNLLDKRRAEEDAVFAWASSRAEFRSAIQARRELSAVAAEMRREFEREMLLQLTRVGAKSIYFATTIARAAVERQKPDIERDPAYMDRELPRLRDNLERQQKNFFAPTDKRLFLSFVKRALALPPGSRIASVDQYFQNASGAELERRIETIYAGTRVLDMSQRNTMFEESPTQLR